MLQEEVNISQYVCHAIYLYECGLNRLKWYKDTGEKRYLDDSKCYMDAANIYMKEITKNENN